MKPGKHGINHSLLMLICCLAVVGIAIAFAYSSGGFGNSGFLWLAMLLCPLLHFFMMRGGHKH